MSKSQAPVRFVPAEEGHGFANPEHQIRFYRAAEEHFAWYLGVHTRFAPV
ncbi:hypothetical protein [Nocardia mangyaensis]|nr:hypothetical protein [Nocardia mangyaensis]